MPSRLELLHIAGKNMMSVEFNGADDDDRLGDWEWGIEDDDIDVGGIRPEVVDAICRSAAKTVIYQIGQDVSADEPMFTDDGAALYVSILGDMALRIDLDEALRSAIEIDLQMYQEEAPPRLRPIAAMLRTIADEIDAALTAAAQPQETSDE